MTTAEFERVNDRRIDLILKQHGEGLTAAEALELEGLVAEVRAYIHERFPPPEWPAEVLRGLEEATDGA